MKDLRTYTRTLALSFAAAAMMACESRVDKDRKADVVQDLIENTQSYEQSDISKSTDIHFEDAAYQTRLTKALMQNNTADLDYLKENNITVVLDQRLGEQEMPSFGQEILGIYYQDTKTLSLWDNGKDETSFGERDYQDYAARSIIELVSALKNERLDKNNSVHYFSSEIKQNGIQSQRSHKWKSANTFNATAQKANPNLAKPPALTP